MCLSEIESGAHGKNSNLRLTDAEFDYRVLKVKQYADTTSDHWRIKNLARVEAAVLKRNQTAILEGIAAGADRVNLHTSQQIAPLVARAEGRVPPRRPDQTPTERKLELDQALMNMRALREERKQCIKEEKQQKEAAKTAKKALERQSKKPKAATKAEPSSEWPDLNSCYHAGFVVGEELKELCDFLGSLEPLEINYRGHPVTTRPKRNWSLQRPDNFAFSLYKWGQETADYPLIEQMPAVVQRLAERLEDHFGHERGFLNNAMATVYETGKNQYIPLHADKAHSFEATGKIENKAPIYNASFLATRTFVIAKPEYAGKTKREGSSFAEGVLKEWPLSSGDLVVLPPHVNATTVHGVPCEPEVMEKRVSLVFRHVTKHWIRYSIREDRSVFWEICDVDINGREGRWKLLKQPTDTVEQRCAKRKRTA